MVVGFDGKTRATLPLPGGNFDVDASGVVYSIADRISDALDMVTLDGKPAGRLLDIPHDILPMTDRQSWTELRLLVHSHF